MDRTIQDYLVSLQNGEVSHEERQQNLRCTQDFVSLALSNIGSQVVLRSSLKLMIILKQR